MSQSTVALENAARRDATVPYTRIGNIYFRKNAGLTARLLRYAMSRDRYGFGVLPVSIGRKRILKDLVAGVVLGDEALSATFPVLADIALPVHGGYKFFDFQKQVVTKWVGRSHNGAHFAHEVENVTIAAQAGFAPDILGSNAEEGWYAESMINGGWPHKWQPARASSYVNKHICEIARMTQVIGTLRPAKEESLQSYLQALVTQIRELCAAQEESGVECQDLMVYVTKVKQKLDAYGDHKIPLTYSHGDFSLVNIVDNGGRMFVLDWESGGFRSPTNDACNFAVTEQYYGRATAGELGLLMELAGDNLQRVAGPDENRQRLALVLGLYYLERIAVLLNRRSTPKLVRVLNGSIRLFREIGLPAEPLVP